MAKRIILGNPANADYGLYVSKPGTHVVDSSNNLPQADQLQFDSRVGSGSLNLKNYGEGLLGIPGTTLTSGTSIGASDTTAVVTHGLGFVPYVIVQWCFQSDISGGFATKMYPANLEWSSVSSLDISTSGHIAHTKGGVTFSVTNQTLTITNNFIGQMKRFVISGNETSRASQGGVAIGYAYLIFDLDGA